MFGTSFSCTEWRKKSYMPLIYLYSVVLKQEEKQITWHKLTNNKILYRVQKIYYPSFPNSYILETNFTCGKEAIKIWELIWYLTARYHHTIAIISVCVCECCFHGEHLILFTRTPRSLESSKKQNQLFDFLTDWALH